MLMEYLVMLAVIILFATAYLLVAGKKK